MSELNKVEIVDRGDGRVIMKINGIELDHVSRYTVGRMVQGIGEVTFTIQTKSIDLTYEGGAKSEK